MAPRRLLGQILKELGLVHEGMVQEALSVQREKGGRIGEILIAMKCVGAADLARALASQAGLGYHDLAAVAPTQDAIAKIDLATARAFGVLPVSLQGKVLKVAIADPANVAMLQDLGFTSGCEIVGVIADGALIQAGLEKHYREDAAESKQRMHQLVQELQQQGG
jgi:type IV pilus assembly protein PilB